MKRGTLRIATKWEIENRKWEMEKGKIGKGK